MDGIENNTVIDIVIKDIRTLKVFKQYKVPFFTGDKDVLKVKCQNHGIDISQLKSALFHVMNNDKEPVYDYNNWELEFLVQYIVNSHHRYIKTTLIIIMDYCKKVLEEDQINDPDVNELFINLQKLDNLIYAHMDKEEKIIFPYICSLEGFEQDTSKYAPNNGLGESIQAMFKEHGEVVKIMQKLELATFNFDLLKNARGNLKSLIYKLNEFIDDMILHIHVENNILYKRALIREEQYH